jgi:hypothetical protein
LLEPVSDALRAAGEARFCVNCGTALNGPFCHSCGAAAQVPPGPLGAPAPRPAATAVPTVQRRRVAPTLPVLLGAGRAETAMFVAAAAVVGFMLLAFPVLGVLTGFAAFAVLVRRYAHAPDRDGDTAARPEAGVW